MSGKIWVFLVIFCTVCIRGEVIHFSKLKRESVKFSITRDLFAPLHPIPSESQPGNENQGISDPRIKKNTQKDLEKEIQNSVSYEGFIEKKQKALALLSINGEFFVVAEGDTVLDKVKILKIEKEKMVLEVDSLRLEIQLKGVNHD